MFISCAAVVQTPSASHEVNMVSTVVGTECVYSHSIRDRVESSSLQQDVGCGCVGGCSTRSRTCACLKRQKEAFKAAGLAGLFNYSPAGSLQDHRLPVFECTPACSCDASCMNRVSVCKKGKRWLTVSLVLVVGRGANVAVRIQKTKNAGWG